MQRGLSAPTKPPRWKYRRPRARSLFLTLSFFLYLSTSFSVSLSLSIGVLLSGIARIRDHHYFVVGRVAKRFEWLSSSSYQWNRKKEHYSLGKKSHWHASDDPILISHVRTLGTKCPRTGGRNSALIVSSNLVYDHISQRGKGQHWRMAMAHKEKNSPCLTHAVTKC